MASQQSPISRLGDITFKVVEWIAVAVMLLMMLHVVANALLRTLLRNPVPATLEVTQYWYLPAIALLGLIVAQARNEHIFADLLFEGFPPLAKRITTIVVELVTATAAAGFAWYGFSQGLHSLDIGSTLGNTSLPLWPGEIFLGVIYCIFTLQLSYAAYRALRFGITIETHPTAGDTFNEDVESELDEKITQTIQERRS